MYKYRLKDVCDENKTIKSFYGIDPNTSEENRWYIDADSVIITIDNDNMVTKLKLK